MADIPPRETSPAAKSEEKLMFSKARSGEAYTTERVTASVSTGALGSPNVSVSPIVLPTTSDSVAQSVSTSA